MITKIISVLLGGALVAFIYAFFAILAVAMGANAGFDFWSGVIYFGWAGAIMQVLFLISNKGE